MNMPARLGAYFLGLAVIFGGALGVGNAVGAVGTQPPASNAHSNHGTSTPMATPAEPDQHTGH